MLDTGVSSSQTSGAGTGVRRSIAAVSCGFWPAFASKRRGTGRLFPKMAPRNRKSERYARIVILVSKGFFSFSPGSLVWAPGPSFHGQSRDPTSPKLRAHVLASLQAAGCSVEGYWPMLMATSAGRAKEGATLRVWVYPLRPYVEVARAFFWRGLRLDVGGEADLQRKSPRQHGRAGGYRPWRLRCLNALMQLRPR